MPLHIALVLSFALHLAAYALADWAGLLAPSPPASRMLLEATLILPEIAAVPPPELQPDEALPAPTTEPALSVPPPPAEALPSPPSASAPTAAIQAPPPAETKPATKPAPPEFYPHEAVRRGLEGEVLVAVTLDGRGRVTAARLERGSGHAILDEAAVRAALSLKFMPGGTRSSTRRFCAVPSGKVMTMS